MLHSKVVDETSVLSVKALAPAAAFVFMLDDEFDRGDAPPRPFAVSSCGADSRVADGAAEAPRAVMVAWLQGLLYRDEHQKEQQLWCRI